jgi:hypothetical protein
VFAGPADTSIYDVKDGQSIGGTLASYGLHWKRAYKGKGSRIAGWALIRNMLGSAKRKDPEKPHLYFWNRAENHIRTLPIMQRDKRKPEDINCFVKGTLVSVENGKIPIENICEGDFVHTPIGLRKVIKTGVSGISPTFKITLSNGTFLQGTPDHKIFVKDIGLVPLCKIKRGDKLCQNYVCITEGLNSKVKMEAILSATHQIVTFLMEQHYCTEQNSKMFLEKFQSDLKYTTKTTINLTTALKILNLFVVQITQDTTCKKDLKKVGIYTKNLKNGENLKKVRNNLELILKNVERTLPKENVRALIVILLLLQNIQQRSFVQKNVVMTLVEKLKKYALFVVHLIGRNHHHPQKLVVENVDGYCGEEKVYNLTTEQAHTYYANDCLVSNTDLEDHLMDSLRYLLNRKASKMRRRKVRT